MENRFKLRISRMFRSSFRSCRSRNISDVLEKAVFTTQNHKNFHLIDPLSPKPRPLPSICRPKCPETTHMIIDNTCIDTLPRRKVSEQYSPFASTASNGRMCPPASPSSPLNPYYERKEFVFGDKKMESAVKNKKNKRTRARKTKKRDNMCIFSSSSQESFNYAGWWFSSDDEKEDETETLFSSKSLSSDSSESLRRRSRRKKHGTLRRRATSSSKISDHMGILPLSEGKVKDSFAVVKKSSDPYNDFRTSMVEMIVEKQIFAAKDLEQLLQCFISLNSHHHHRIILEVFTEIWEALFSNWC